MHKGIWVTTFDEVKYFYLSLVTLLLLTAVETHVEKGHMELLHTYYRL